MEHISGTSEFKLNNTVVTIGKFDCFHKGHQLLFKVAKELKQDGMQQVILTFDTNPVDVVCHSHSKFVISRDERHFFAEKNSVDYFIEYPFDEHTMDMSPEEFVKAVLVDRLGVKALVCGDDFRFGKDRAGGISELKELGEKYGFIVRVVQRISYHDEAIGSTRIKEEIQKGNIEAVNEMLQRPFSLSGIVEQGMHVGRKMGLPTINFAVSEYKLLPPDGVYATRTRVNGTVYMSITNIGVRPTFYENGGRFIETYILDFDGDIYGDLAVVYLYKFIRAERKFESADALVSQINKDINATKEFFEERGQEEL